MKQYASYVEPRLWLTLESRVLVTARQFTNRDMLSIVSRALDETRLSPEGEEIHVPILKVEATVTPEETAARIARMPEWK